MSDATEKPAGGQFRLLSSRRFAPLFLTQFLGAFNDNLYKNALIVLVTFQSAQWTSMRPEILDKLTAQIPLRRLGDVAEIASAALFIVENDFFTGRCIDVDGGMRL